MPGKIIPAMSLFVFCLLVGCASSRAPERWLPSAEEAQRDVYGSWIEISYETGGDLYRDGGEFIAIDSQYLYYANESELQMVPLSAISKAKIVVYRSESGQLAGWTVAGSISTVSHGFFLILSLPVWIISGSAFTAACSFEPVIDIEPGDWDRVRIYARYPTGLPEDFDSVLLRPIKRPARWSP
jgi:hypothetical protein